LPLRRRALLPPAPLSPDPVRASGCR